MFTPDFYLPEHDLYVELTTMKQSSHHPQTPQAAPPARALSRDSDVVLLTRRDYYELLARVGYGAVEITSLPRAEISSASSTSPTEIAESRRHARRPDLRRLQPAARSSSSVSSRALPTFSPTSPAPSLAP